MAVGHQTGIFLDYASVSAAYKGYPGAKFKGFKDINKAKEYLRLNEPPTAEYSDKKVTRTKPKNYGWSMKGTKASRREAKAMAAKNNVKGEVLHCRTKASHFEPKDPASVAKVKRMARTSGIKDLDKDDIKDLSKTQPEDDSTTAAAKVIDLTRDPMDQDAGSESSVYKDVARLRDDLKTLEARAIRSLSQVISAKRSKAQLGVRFKRDFAPGLSTTMIHRSRIARDTVSSDDREISLRRSEAGSHTQYGHFEALGTRSSGKARSCRRKFSIRRSFDYRVK